MILRVQSVISLFTCSCLICMASSPSSTIGLVLTSGEVQVNGLSVPGNSAIFAGNLISSGASSASLQLSDGTSAIMRPGTTMVVYGEHSVLKQGVTMQGRVDKHSVLADGLRISGATPNAVVLVGVKDASHMEVAAKEGESDVWTASGDLVARITPGKTLSFAMAQASPEQQKDASFCGELDANYLLTDSHTGVTYQLHGGDLDPLIGKTVKVSGLVANPPTGSQYEPLTVLKIKARDKRCDEPAIWRNKGLVLLLFIGFGGALIGLAAADDLGPSPVTPTIP